MTKGVYDPQLLGRLLAQTDPASVSTEDWAQMKDWLAAIKASDAVAPPPRVPIVEDSKAPTVPLAKRLGRRVVRTLRGMGVTSDRVAKLGGPIY